MQKLVTIYLDNGAYGQGKMIVTSYAEMHGLVEEHLANYLSEGWSIKQLQAFGGNSDGLAVRGWIAAVIERPSDK
ncbi:MAG: hypothetical protein L0211_20295 [Planctomycetaceae bacterium]|nr:hypothetical protein [Planctomycetaceae bacterium]